MTLQVNKLCLLVISTAVFLITGSAQTGQEKQLVTQKFVYKTAKVSEVYMVWATNFWKTPDSNYFPQNTYLKDKMAYTKMIHQGDSFYNSITLPYLTRVDYYFWMPKDSKGKEINGWDTRHKSTYLSNFTSNKIICQGDSNIEISQPAFSIFAFGRLFIILSLILASITFFLYRKNLKITRISFLTGLLTTAIIYVFLARYEIAGLSNKSASIVFGSVFSDLIWIVIICIFFFPLLYFFRTKKMISNIVITIFSLVIILTVLSSLLNIEVVKQLGTPLTIKWLYYSDFLKGNDARTGIAKTLTNSFLKNIFMLMTACVIISVSLSPYLQQLERNKKAFNFIFSLLIIFLSITYYDNKINHFKNPKIQAAGIAFISSIFNPNDQAELLKEKITDETISYINNYHNNLYTTKLDSADVIDNIILFVSESTPKQYIIPSDSVLNYTPNLNKWLNISKVYTNMYAQIPSTPNSMFSLVSGVYPMINYKSAVEEKLHLPVASLPQILNKEGWATSLFFSSDLKYANMDVFAKKQSFSTIADMNTIPCEKKYTITHSNIDGIDDECLIQNYVGWLDTTSTKKKFSMLWTNQTHSPYYTDDVKIYTKENSNLNQFLNALHHTDLVFGHLIEELKKRNKLKSTLVILIGDHGEAFGTHDQTLHASRIYEENVHIPCILFNPVLFKGTSNDQIHGLIDIDVTIAQLLGLDKPKEWQGRSLFGDNPSGRTFFVSPYTDLIIGTRDKNWKYIYNVDTGEEELYNLATDPEELVNIYDQHPEVIKKEHEILIGWMQYVHNKFTGWSYDKKFW